MDAVETAKSELRVSIKEIERHYGSILDQVEKIQNAILPGLLNATPTVQGKNAIFREWSPMVLDLANGLAVVQQGIDRAYKKIL